MHSFHIWNERVIKVRWGCSFNFAARGAHLNIKCEKQQGWAAELGEMSCSKAVAVFYWALRGGKKKNQLPAHNSEFSWSQSNPPKPLIPETKKNALLESKTHSQLLFHESVFQCDCLWSTQHISCVINYTLLKCCIAKVC